MRAAATMTRHVIVVPPTMPLPRAWALMQAHRIRHLPVVDDGRLVGIVSDRDLLLRGAPRADGTPLTFGDDAATLRSHLASTMIDDKVDAIVITDGREGVKGLVTSTDLLALLTDGKDVVRLPFDFTVHTEAAAA
jgi:acetoin utilization protein AcuB